MPASCGSENGSSERHRVLPRAHGPPSWSRAHRAAGRRLKGRRAGRRDRNGDEDTDHSGPGSVFAVVRSAGDPASSIRYVVQARIEVEGKLRFISTTSNPVITNGKPTTVDIRVRRCRDATDPRSPLPARGPGRSAGTGPGGMRRLAGDTAGNRLVQLMSDLATLADDSMEGRLVGTAGGARARRFVQARFRAIGLDTLPTGMLQRVPCADGLAGKAANVVGLVPGGPGPAASSWSPRTTITSAPGDGVVFNGADDNASGTAALLAMADWFRHHPPANTADVRCPRRRGGRPAGCGGIRAGPSGEPGLDPHRHQPRHGEPKLEAATLRRGALALSRRSCRTWRGWRAVRRWR